MTIHRTSSDDVERDRCAGKGAAAAVSDAGSDGAAGGAPVQERRNRLVAACSCILGAETAERLAYYGLATNLSLYAKGFLGYPAAEATSMLQAWKATVYLTPLLGAYLADAYLGRFWVILLFSSLYLVGLSGVTAVNAVPSVAPRFHATPLGGSFRPTRALFWAAMYLIALGSGGIKSCVSSFGGDQFREDSARERQWRSSFFNWFYFCVNLGSLVATLVVVPVQEAKGYAIGFGIPTALMGVAIIVLVAGAVARLYTYVPPDGSPLYRIYQVFAGAFRQRRQPLPADPTELFEPAPGEGKLAFSMAHTDRLHGLDRAAVPHGRPGAYQVSRTEVEETKALVGIGPVFLCVCIWQMAYDPIFTLLPLPGDVMDRTLGSRFKIPASSISFANTAGVMISVAAYDIFVVPIATKMGRPISTMSRIGAGFIVAILALLSAGFIEMARYRVVRSSGLVSRWEEAAAADPSVDYSEARFVQPMSIWWQAIPYFIMGAAETLTNVGVMELFFNEVSEGTRALGSSINLLTTAVGTYLAGGLNMAIAAATRGDPWVADNPLYGAYDKYFFLNAGILAAGYVAFLFVARAYKEKPIVPHHLVGKGPHAADGAGAPPASGPTSPATWHAARGLRARWPRVPGSPGGSSGSPASRDAAGRSPFDGVSSNPVDPL
ncbi:MAG: POT family-domain-containing protein [Monoraphidium minutum]|nr:MAG: POT family-domain-containing protein [Monoraphidium minutum]